MNAKHIISKLSIIKKILVSLGFNKSGYRLKHNEQAFGFIPKIYSTIICDAITAFIVVYFTLTSFIEDTPTIASWSILKHSLSYICLLTGIFILTEVHKIAWSTMDIRGIKDIFFALLIVTIMYSFIVRIMSKSFTLPDSYIIAVMGATFFALLTSRLGYNVLRKRFKILQNTTIKPQLLRESVLILGCDDEIVHFIPSLKKHFNIAGVLTENSRSIGGHIRGVEIIGNVLSLSLVLKRIFKNGGNIERIFVTNRILCKGYIRSFLMENNGINIPIHNIDSTGGNYKNNIPIIGMQDIFNSDIVSSYSLERQKLYEEFSGQNILVVGNNSQVIKEFIDNCQNLDVKSIIFTGMQMEQLEEIKAFFEAKNSGIIGHFFYTDVTCYQSLRAIFLRHKLHKVIYFASNLGILDKGGYTSSIDLLRFNLLVPSYLAKLAFQEKITDFVLISSNKVENQQTLGSACIKIAEDYALSIGNYSGNKYTNFFILRWDNIAGQPNSVTHYFQTQLHSNSDVIINGEENSERILNSKEATTQYFICNQFENR